MGLTDNLIIGNEYTKEEFGISYPASLRAENEIERKTLAFFTINNPDGYKNEIHNDGFVFEDSNKNNLPPWEHESKDGRHIFVRENPNEKFVYYGKAKYKKRYSQTQIKLFC